MGWPWMDGGWWWMGFGMLPAALLLLVLIGLVVWLASRNSGGQPARRVDPAEETLRQRFASGEIDAEEYERRLALLRK